MPVLLFSTLFLFVFLWSGFPESPQVDKFDGGNLQHDAAENALFVLLWLLLSFYFFHCRRDSKLNSLSVVHTYQHSLYINVLPCLHLQSSLRPSSFLWSFHLHDWQLVKLRINRLAYYRWRCCLVSSPMLFYCINITCFFFINVHGI